MSLICQCKNFKAICKKVKVLCNKKTKQFELYRSRTALTRRRKRYFYGFIYTAFVVIYRDGKKKDIN